MITGSASAQQYAMKAIRDSHILKQRARCGPAEIDLQSLQGEIDKLRLYVSVLFRIVIQTGAITARDAQNLFDLLDSNDGDSDGKAINVDPITGQPLPVEKNPFEDLV